jgi:protein-S-isoprenylcysteine O-methyltransferase Ste14
MPFMTGHLVQTSLEAAFSPPRALFSIVLWRFLSAASLCLFVVLFLLAEPWAVAQTAAGIRVLDRGIYQAETIGRTPKAGTTGLVNTVQNPRLISSTTTVIGQVGLRFGLRYSLVSNAQKTLRLVIVFPPAGLRNPQTGHTHFQTESEIAVPAGVVLYWEYHFENEWEIAEGIWRFEFWEGTEKLGQQRFCVHRLDGRTPAPGAPRACASDLLG